MPPSKKLPSQETIQANIDLHTSLAQVYDKDEPHWRPENQAKVKDRMLALLKDKPQQKHLDIACGSGFLINLSRDIFEEVHGIDITPSMMERIDQSSGNIHLQISLAEDLPYEDNSFDFVTGYSCLDHFEDYVAVLSEAYRVLRPGGIAYFDLIPNASFWRAIEDTPDQTLNGELWSGFVMREKGWLAHNDKDIEEKYGINSETMRKAEPYKERGGITADLLHTDMKKIGFSTVSIHYDWFLGEAKVLHQEAYGNRDIVNSYLQEALPLTQHLYKYLWFALEK